MVDDNMLIRKMVRAILEEEGLECHEAQDVTSTLAALGQLKPDLCFLDQTLPDGEGTDVLMKLGGSGAAVRPRVYLLTGTEDESLVEQARALGAEGVLLKPVSPAQLLQAVRGR